MIQEFENYLLSIKGYSELTARAYVKDVKAFIKWAKHQDTNVRWSTITRETIDKYVTELVSQGLKPATTNRKLSSIAAIFNYMKREGYEVENPCKYESRRKRPQTIPNTIPQAELKQAYEHAQGVTKLIMGLIMTTGMRIQEILDMTWEDVDFTQNSIKVNGKGLKQRLVYTTSEVLAPLRNVRDHMPVTGAMFKLEQREVRQRIYDALKPFSSARQLSPHAIRHTFATHAATCGANVSTLGQILGHKHLETTQKYIDMTMAPVRSTCQQYNLFN